MMTPQAPGLRKVTTIGNYRFTGKRLGRGNFAKVEEAVHTTLNTKVAVKIMDMSLIKEEYVIKNLLREARIMSKLSHPNITILFETMHYKHMYYIVTELVNGSDLSNFIKAQRNGKLEESSSRVFARQLISAISHMHNLGIVHRDLKMDNIMLTNQSKKIKIVDFGLSNDFSANRLLKTHCGSPEYAAPELFVEGKQYGPEVDIWSLGVILYGMVNGCLPFVSTAKEGAPHEVRRKKLLEQINKGLGTNHRKVISLFSSEYKVLLPKLLVIDPTKRLTINEISHHPWVTEKGRKILKANNYKGLPQEICNNIVATIGEIKNLDSEEVKKRLKMDPFGPISGMFKLLSYEEQEREVNPTPTFPLKKQNTLPQVPARHQIIPQVFPKIHLTNKRQTHPIKSAPLAKVSRISTIRDAKSIIDKRRELLFKPKERDSCNVVNKNKSETNNTINQIKKNFKVKIVNSESCNRCKSNRRFAEEVKVKRTMNCTPGGDASNNPPVDNFNRLINNVTYKNGYKMARVSEGCIRKSFSKTKLIPGYSNGNETPSKLIPTRVRAGSAGGNATVESRRRSSIPTPVKSMKRNVISAGVAASNKSIPSSKYEDGRNKRPTNLGNVICTKSFSTNIGKVDLRNEPIARSIAGYVRRNFSDKLESLKWLNNVKPSKSNNKA